MAPWCHCGVSGNRRDECEAFRGLFTRNHCLGERLGRGGAAPGRAGVRSALTAYRPYHAAWPAGAHFAAAKWALYCRPAPLGICAHLSPETRRQTKVESWECLSWWPCVREGESDKTSFRGPGMELGEIPASASIEVFPSRGTASSAH